MPDSLPAMDAKPSVSAGSAEPEPALADLRPQRPAARLHRPIRAVVALVELAAVVALGVAAVWAWQRVTVPYELPPSDNPAVPRTVDRWSGPWVGATFGLVALAGVLVLDAVRQLVLAVRAGGWRTRPVADPEPTSWL